MHRNRSHGNDDRRPDPEHRNEATTERQDAAVDLAVLVLLLHRYPAQLTTVELEREIVADQSSSVEVDAIERAVRDLVGAGLLHRHGDFVVPSRAAVRFDELATDCGCQ